MEVKYRIRDKDKGGFVWFPGEFLTWGTDYEEFENGPGNFTCGIIKKPDGQVIMIYAENIKFANPPKSEQGDSKNNVQQTKYAIPESCKECGHLGQCGATHATIACLTMLKFRESVHL